MKKINILFFFGLIAMASFSNSTKAQTSCPGFTTYSQGGYGGNGAPGNLLINNFSSWFPDGLTIGCTNTVKFTSSAAVRSFLPSGGGSNALPAGNTVNPTNYRSTLAGQLVAMTINLAFDNHNTSARKLKDLVVASGPFAGKTVQFVVDNANLIIGGCPAFNASLTDYNSALTTIVLTYDNGGNVGSYLSCPAPQVEIHKSVIAANGTDTIKFSQEPLYYTLAGSNTGNSTSYNTVVVDTIPANVTYIPGTLEVVSAPGVAAGMKTDAEDADEAYVGTNGSKTFVKFFIGNGATGAQGGQLAAGANYTLKFNVKAGLIPATVKNIASILGESAFGDALSDTGIAIIGPAGAPVAVKMTSFKASLVDSKNALLTWDTESELQNDRFEIERSEDGIQFINRGKVNGNGSTSFKHNYSFTDELNISSAIAYYRLKIVDKDGKFSYTKVVALRIKGSVNIENFSVYPNPFISNIKVSLNSQTDVNATFRIISFDGKELARRNINIQKGDNIIVISDIASLPKGNYMLEVATPAEKFIKKIMKN